MFQISPYFRKKFQTLRKIVTIFPFPTNFLIFIRQNFCWPFFSHRPQISPYFPCFSTFPPVSRKLLFPPYFEKFPPLYKNSPAFYILYVYFVSPYFDHDAFMHHPMHVLNAPAYLSGFLEGPPCTFLNAWEMCPLPCLHTYMYFLGWVGRCVFVCVMSV